MGTMLMRNGYINEWMDREMGWLELRMGKGETVREQVKERISP